MHVGRYINNATVQMLPYYRTHPFAYARMRMRLVLCLKKSLHWVVLCVCDYKTWSQIVQAEQKAHSNLIKVICGELDLEMPMEDASYNTGLVELFGVRMRLIE